jgi:hypothetical protein
MQAAGFKDACMGKRQFLLMFKFFMRRFVLVNMFMGRLLLQNKFTS